MRRTNPVNYAARPARALPFRVAGAPAAAVIRGLPIDIGSRTVLVAARLCAAAPPWLPAPGRPFNREPAIFVVADFRRPAAAV
ncbi:MULTISPECIES: hypothetical protein [unclassified Micromonospora]|uniref:hypothetical protein n=1 Tax=unclassified Micromonospora TaxID=2617518 RepID=UPI003645CC78